MTYDQRFDSYAPVRVRVRVLASDGTDIVEDGVNVSDAVEQMVEAVHFENKTTIPTVVSSSACWVLNVDFNDATEEALDYAIQYVRPGVRLTASFDYETATSAETILDGTVARVAPRLNDGGGFMLSVVVQPRALHEIKSKNPRLFSVHVEGGTATAAMRKILAHLETVGITLLTRVNGISTVQESTENLPHNIGYYPARYDYDVLTWAFAELAQWAYDERGEPFVPYVESTANGDVLHFHTQTYAYENLYRGEDTVLVYDPRRPDSDVISLVVDDNSLNAAYQGFNGASYIGWDPDKGTAFAEAAGAMVGNGDLMERLTDATNAYTIGAAMPVREQAFVAPSRAWLVMKRAMYMESLRRNYLKVRMVIRGTHAYRIGSKFTLLYRRPNGTANWISGTYSVTAVEHNVTAQGWSTTLAAFAPGLSAQGDIDETVLERRRKAAETVAKEAAERAARMAQIANGRTIGEAGGATREESGVMESGILSRSDARHVIVIRNPNAAAGVTTQPVVRDKGSADTLPLPQPLPGLDRRR